MRLDHVIYGTTDLDAAAARVEAALGLAVQPGGHHDGQGSHNRIVPLGPGYLELLAIDDPEEAASSPIGRILLDVLTRDGLIAYAVFVDDVQRLGLPVHMVSRDGVTASVAGVEEALREPFLPFFVASDRPRTWPAGEGLTWVEVAGDATRLRDWLHGEELPIRVVAGDPAVRAIGIGEREYRP
jgi:catechol 2,3-dioxygenase-like lactoylglutathione lyase family enzyme